MNFSVANLVALITGIAAIITAIGGVFVAIRAVRNRERKAAKEDIRLLDNMLADERHMRIDAERRNYELAVLLAAHGLVPPPPPPEASDA